MYDKQAYQYIAHSFTKNTLWVHLHITEDMRSQKKSGIRPTPRNMVFRLYVLFYTFTYYIWFFIKWGIHYYTQLKDRKKIGVITEKKNS